VQADQERRGVQSTQAAVHRLQRGLPTKEGAGAQGIPLLCALFLFLCIQFLFTTSLLCIDSTLARILWCAVFFPHLSHSYSLQLKEEKERAQREEEERRNRIELEQFQRKFEKGRSKDRRRPEVEAVAPSRPVYLYLLGAAVPLLSAFFALWWMNA